jgi:hypothetical protein
VALVMALTIQNSLALVVTLAAVAGAETIAFMTASALRDEGVDASTAAAENALRSRRR